MKKILIQALIILQSFLVFGQEYSQCKIYQFTGNNDSDTALAAIQTFDSLGNLVLYNYIDFKLGNISSLAACRVYFEYKDTLLIKKTKAFDNGDSTIIIYQYNEGNLLIREQKNRYSGIKEQMDIWGGKPLLSYVNYFYDEHNKLIKKNGTNRKAKVMWKEKYVYSDTSFSITRKTKWLFNSAAKPYTIYYYLNENGDIIREKKISSKGDIIYFEELTYNEDRRLIKTIRKESFNEETATSIYIYH